MVDTLSSDITLPDRRHLKYPCSIRALLAGYDQPQGRRLGVKDKCRLFSIDYSTLQRACNGERSLSNHIAAVDRLISLSDAQKYRLADEYKVHSQYWQLMDRRRSSSIRPSSNDHQLLEIEISKAGFSMTSLIDDDARAFIADTVIENYRSSGHASKAVMFGFSLISWIEDTLINIDFDAHLSIGAIARLVAYAAYTIDDRISFQRAARLMQRSIKITDNNWLRGGFLHHVRRALADTTNPFEAPSRLRRTAELALQAAVLGRSTEVNHPAAKYWEPSHFLAAVAMLSSRAAVDGVDESEIETVRMILDDLNSPDQQLDFKLIAALNIAEIRTQAGMIDKAALEVSSAITELDKHLHTYAGLRAFARRIQGDIALISSATAGKGERDERLASAQALYTDAGYMYSRYGNPSMHYKLDKRVQLATDLMQLRTAWPATDTILRHPSFRLRIA